MKKILTILWNYILQFFKYLEEQEGDDAERVTNPPANPPIENPEKEEPPYSPPERLAKYLVVLEAGHYQYTSGKRGPWFNINGQRVRAEEWFINRKQVEAIYLEFQQKNKEINNPIIDIIVADREWLQDKSRYDYEYDARHLHTGKGIEYLSYRTQRLNDIYKANEYKYNEIIFLSVHHNAIDNMPYIKGLEFYYHGLGNQLQSVQLGRFFERYFKLSSEVLRPNTTRPDTWLYKSGFYVLRKTNYKVKLLLELGYMTNKEDVVKMTSRYVRKQRSSDIYKSIKDYFYG